MENGGVADRAQQRRHTPRSILHAPFLLSPAACGLHRQSPVDKPEQGTGCGTTKNHPQTTVYDISRALPCAARVFPSFPKYYYDDENLYCFLFSF